MTSPAEKSSCEPSPRTTRSTPAVTRATCGGGRINHLFETSHGGDGAASRQPARVDPAREVGQHTAAMHQGRGGPAHATRLDGPETSGLNVNVVPTET